MTLASVKTVEHFLSRNEHTKFCWPMSVPKTLENHIRIYNSIKSSL